MKKGIKITAILLILSLLFSFENENQQSYFQGIVEYDISFPNQTKKLSKAVTTKFTIYYKEGNIRKEYKNENDSILFYSIYKIDENKNYGITPKNDTIIYYQPSEKMFDFTSSERINNKNGKQINEDVVGFKCEIYKAQVKYNSAPENVLPTNYIYFVSKGLKADSKNLKGDGSNFIFMNNGSIILKYIVDNPTFRIVTASRVIEKNLENSLFEVDLDNKILIESE